MTLGVDCGVWWCVVGCCLCLYVRLCDAVVTVCLNIYAGAYACMSSYVRLCVRLCVIVFVSLRVGERGGGG